MKTASRILIACSIVIQGCFTISPVSSEKGAPIDRKVFFYLKDGSRIESYHHLRVKGGYQVTGEILRKGGDAQTFQGLVLDAEIKRFGVERFDLFGTVLAASIVALVVTSFYLLKVPWLTR